jgi:hypothetical protein
MANCRAQLGSDLHVLPLSSTPTSDCVHIPLPASNKAFKISFRQVRDHGDGVVDWHELHVDRSLLETGYQVIIGGASACMAQRRLIGGLIAGVNPVRANASGLATVWILAACRWAEGRGF